MKSIIENLFAGLLENGTILMKNLKKKIENKEKFFFRYKSIFITRKSKINLKLRYRKTPVKII